MSGHRTSQYNYSKTISLALDGSYAQLIARFQRLLLLVMLYPRVSSLKSICVEFDLHNVVITTLLKFKVSYTIGFLVKKRLYLYAVELVSSNQLTVSIFYVEVPGILVHHIKA